MGKVFAFDLYGTLLSTNSISKALIASYGSDMADSIAMLWRQYQIEYTFRLNSMRQYQDFEEVTKKAFLHTLAEHGLEMEPGDVDTIMHAYDNLSVFKDVDLALQKLTMLSDLECVIFSNGTKRMIDSSVNGSSTLSKHRKLFSKLVSVDHVQSFKPTPQVYKYLAHCVDRSADQSDIWLVSGNPFDIVGARSAGLNAAWVDRDKQGWQDRLGPEPSKIIHNLSELVELAKES